MSFKQTAQKWITLAMPYGPVGLFFWAFAESSFFPIPPDFLLIALALLNPEKGLWLGLVCTVGSVLGAIFGYVIGLKGGRPLIRKIVSAEKLEKVEHYYNKYDVWAVGIAGFTPLPYKIFTITAGMFKLNIKRFIIASIVSRGGRFFIVGGLFFFFGETIKPFVLKYFDKITLGLVVLLFLGIYSLKFLHRKKK